MRSIFRPVVLSLVLIWPSLAAGEEPGQSKTAVAAVVESTLRTAAGNIRQFAFDGSEETFFATEQPAGPADHFTLVLDAPVSLKSLKVGTGRPDGSATLEAGVVEVTTDGKRFEELARFTAGMAHGAGTGQKILAVRLRPTADLKHPLAIREITLETEPPIARFLYPIEITAVTEDAPELKEWAEKVVRVCERAYPMINQELKSAGFKPRTTITMTLKNDYSGVAMAGGGRITGSVKYFKAHPEDIGAMVHETVHCVQQYRAQNNPGWLVEGIADYVRFFKYEPGKLQPLSPMRARYNGSYKVTAAFLAYLTEKYDKDLVRKLNQAMREGEYKEELFKVLTGKPLTELGEEWRASLDK